MKEVIRPMEGNPSQCWILDSRHWTADSLSVELGFPISNANKIPGFLELFSGFQSLGFPIP